MRALNDYPKEYLNYRGIELSDTASFYNKDSRCELINEKVKKSIDDFIDLLNLNNHKLLSSYHNNSIKVLIDFNCNHKPHWISPSKYKLGRGCPKCADMYRNEKKSKKAKDEFILLVKSNGHELLSEYIDAKTKVSIDYNCGHNPHMIIPNNYKKQEGSGCPKCSGKSLIQAREDLLLLVKENNHILLSDYINAFTKVLIDFKCGHEPHWIKPSKYKIGRGCWACSESKGEKKIRKWLECNDIKFESQKTLSGLVGIGGGNLSYDFYLPIQNVLIEYQGEFHDGKANEYVSENLGIQQEHDKRKREYATNNSIKLLEIWYWDFNNVEKILTDNIKIE